MNEFLAKDTKDSLAIANNGVAFSLSLTGVDELILEYKDGMFHILSGEKEKYILDGFQTGDTISTGISTGETSHSPSGSRLFFGRKEGRFSKIEKHLLDEALNDYEAALARNKRGGHVVLPKWAKVFNVQPSTVQGWMAKHRITRRQKPLTLGEILKQAADGKM